MIAIQIYNIMHFKLKKKNQKNYHLKQLHARDRFLSVIIQQLRYYARCDWPCLSSISRNSAKVKIHGQSKNTFISLLLGYTSGIFMKS